MSDMVQIRSWRQMWDDYISEGKKQGLTNEQIKANLIEAFRKEIFGQLTFRLKTGDILGILQGTRDADSIPHTPENEEIVRNIFKGSMNKWRALVKESRKHLMTMNLIQEDDLTLWDAEEDDEDGGYDIQEEPEEEEMPEEEPEDETRA